MSDMIETARRECAAVMRDVAAMAAWRLAEKYASEMRYSEGSGALSVETAIRAIDLDKVTK